MQRQTHWMPTVIASALSFAFSFPISGAAQAAEPMLSPVVVTATRQETRASDLLSDVTVIDREEIERNSGDTIVELLTRQAGIQSYRSGGQGAQTGFFVRGANTNQVKVLVDGLPLNGAADQSGSSALYNLPLANVERIEILRGPASTLYGADAIGGVIQIFTRKGEPGVKADGFIGYGTHNTYQANAGISAGGEQWRLRVDGSRDSTQGISAQTNATRQDADKEGYYNNAGSVAFSFLPAQGQELGASVRHNEGRSHFDSGNVPANSNYDFYNDFRSSQWQVFSKNRITSSWRSNLLYGQTTEWTSIHSLDFMGSPEVSTFETQNRQLSWQNDIDLSLGKLLLAAEHLEQQGSPSQNFDGRDSMRNNSLLAGWTGNWNRHRWQLNARHDEHSAFGSKDTYGLAYGYQLTPQWRAQASYGTAFKAPSLSQLYMPIYGNPALQPEEAKNREIGLVWEQGKHSASATYYRNNVTNLIGYDPFTFQSINIGRASLEGVTLAYSGKFGDWNLRASYDWLDAVNEESRKQLPLRARNKAQVAVLRRLGLLETGVELNSVGSRYASTRETGRMGGYTLVNLTARYALSKNWSLEGRIDNLFDKQYETSRADYFNYTNLNTYGTLGTTAFVGIRYTPN
ncbi:TonB-dependent receptor domain-containing protein [Noviherbaspirillum cavernae]|nr:TonB-dependent receptor [Noviherbaspirillum cavernae]